MCALRLEVFTMPDAPLARTTVVMDVGALEDLRILAYEQGYTAGWDDAAAAQTDDQSRIKADFARNLQSLGFTFQEARMHVLRAIHPPYPGNSQPSAAENCARITGVGGIGSLDAAGGPNGRCAGDFGS